MGRQLRVQRPPIRNISDLRDRCLKVWYNLSPVIYQGLMASMPRRVEAVLRAKVQTETKAHTPVTTIHESQLARWEVAQLLLGVNVCIR
ncbi:transposase domain containing protein [Nephila pilipes]|uniref:Transposase domain containing protein n=1 Tax=Nephila pilipes TaxID=299642 RepID=A0A8X6NAF7_NEPPI|nr:transposase domain containing protein [Nephila pilipes]